jgi:hypothetical protein
MFIQLTGCAGTSYKESPASVDTARRPNAEERWGVRIEGIRLTASGHMLDFRYRILDPEKASPLVNRTIKPYLIDQASGAKFMVPTPPKVGSFRQTSVKPYPDRTYFIFFANPGGYLKQGSLVTVVIGEFRAENIVVE